MGGDKTIKMELSTKQINVSDVGQMVYMDIVWDMYLNLRLIPSNRFNQEVVDKEIYNRMEYLMQKSDKLDSQEIRDVEVKFHNTVTLNIERFYFKPRSIIFRKKRFKKYVLSIFKDIFEREVINNTIIKIKNGLYKIGTKDNIYAK